MMKAARVQSTLLALFCLLPLATGIQILKRFPQYGIVSHNKYPHIPPHIPPDTFHEPLPKCAEPCTAEIYKRSNCTKDNWDCLCAAGWISEASDSCYNASCFPVVKDYLKTLNITTTDCAVPDREQAPLVKVASITIGVVALFCVVLRLLERANRSSNRYCEILDDWIMMINLILLIAFISVGVELSDNGQGRDTWTLKFKTVEILMKLLIVHEVLYVAIVNFTKLSILFVYFHIFPVWIMPWLRIAIPITMGIVVCSAIAQSLSLVFQCTPVDFFWDRMIDERHGTCMNITSWGLANGATNVLLDIWLIAMPLPEILKLRLYWKKKVKAMLMFIVGCLVILISVPRLFFMHEFTATYNPSWDISMIAFLSALEAYIAVICACLPRIYILFSRLYKSNYDSRPNDLHHQFIPMSPMISTLRTLRNVPTNTTASAPASERRESANPMVTQDQASQSWDLRHSWENMGRPDRRRSSARSSFHGGRRSSVGTSLHPGEEDEVEEEGSETESILQEITAVSAPGSTHHSEDAC